MFQRGGYCGVDCDSCDAYLGTVNDEPERLEAMAEWVSERIHMLVGPEQVRCLGCFSDEKPQVEYVKMCLIRACARERGGRLCGECPEYGCALLERFWKLSPQTRERMDRWLAERG